MHLPRIAKNIMACPELSCMMTVRHNGWPVLRRPIYFAIPCEVKRQSAQRILDYVTETLD